MSTQQVHHIRDNALAASLRRVLGRPTGLRLVTRDERPSADEARRARILAECRAINGGR